MTKALQALLTESLERPAKGHLSSPELSDTAWCVHRRKGSNHGRSDFCAELDPTIFQPGSLVPRLVVWKDVDSDS